MPITQRRPSLALRTSAFALLIMMGLHPATAPASTRSMTNQDLATLRDLAGMSLSPDGRWAAFQIIDSDPQRNIYTITWNVIATSGSETVRQRADGGRLMISGPFGNPQGLIPPPAAIWSPDSRWLAYLRYDDASTQIWRVNRTGGAAVQLTHNAADVRSFVVSRDGGRLLFESEPSRAQIKAGLAQEARTGYLFDTRFEPLSSREPVLPPDANIARDGLADTQNMASQRVIWSVDATGKNERRATDAETAEFRTLTAPRIPGRPNSHTHIALSPNGSAAWTQPSDPEQKGLFVPLTLLVQSRSATRPTICTAPECSGDAISWLAWKDDSELIYARREGPHLRYKVFYRWRPQGSEPPRLILRTASEGSLPPACALQQEVLACVFEDSNFPPRVAAIDIDKGTVRTLYDPNPGFGMFDTGAAPEFIEIKAASGANTRGILVLPPNWRPQERLPLVIVTYSCSGFLRGATGDEYPVFPLAAQGFAVLCYSKPVDRQRSLRLTVPEYAAWAWGPGDPIRHQIEDTLFAVVENLSSRGLIDPDRVAITGLSFGAEIVGHAMVHMPSLAAAISSGYPGSPGPQMYPLMSEPAREALRKWGGLGAPEETPERWRRYGFTQNIDRVHTPLLMNVADYEMLPAAATKTALSTAKRAVEMYVFPDEYHVKWQPAHRLAIYNRNTDWLNFWLRGTESGLMGDALQYVRWREMRDNQCRLFGKQKHLPWYCGGQGNPVDSKTGGAAHEALFATAVARAMTPRVRCSAVGL